jgi:branched-subunit amino acid ABC-type transport system permease component
MRTLRRRVRALLPYLVLGLVSGSIYGLTAMGLVLTYKTTGVFNFAHGAVATGAAYLFYELDAKRGLPWPIALALAVALIALLGGPLMEAIGSRLRRVPVATQVVATIGLLLAIQGIVVAIFGAVAMPFPAFLSSRTVRLPGVFVGIDQIVVFGVAAVLAVGLFVFFRSSRTGLSMQAVVDNPDLVGLRGTSAVRVRTVAWMVGLATAALSGVLLGPSVGLNAPFLTLLVVQAFGAAAVGGFASLPLVYVGGLLLGVAAAIAQKYVPGHQFLEGVPSSLPFAFLLAMMLIAPGRLARRTTGGRVPPPPARPLPPVVRRFGPLVVVGLAAAVPAVVGTKLPIYAGGAAYVVLFASLALLVRTSGQASLCHAGFAAVGASSFSHFTHGAGLPWALGLILAGLVAVPVGALVAIPAIRLSGIYLALGTFGFGVLLQQLVYRTHFMFGRSGPLPVPRPAGLDGDVAFYYVILTIAVLTCLVIAVLTRQRLGRLLHALADSPLALGAQGVDVNVTRVLVFCISAFFAAIAGALLAALSGSVDVAPFDPFQSLLYLVVLAVAGSGQLRAPVVAAALLAVVPAYIAGSDTLATYEPVVFGLSAVAIALAEGSRGELSALVRRGAERGRARIARGPAAARLERAT